MVWTIPKRTNKIKKTANGRDSCKKGGAMTKKRLYIIATLYFSVLFLLMVAPWTVERVNTIVPEIFGFPQFQAWIVIYVICVVLGLWVLFLMEDFLEKRAKKQGEAK